MIKIYLTYFFSNKSKKKLNMSNNLENENNNDVYNDNHTQDEIYRFIQDLEFVQCLSNPQYLECKF